MNTKIVKFPESTEVERGLGLRADFSSCFWKICDEKAFF